MPQAPTFRGNLTDVAVVVVSSESGTDFAVFAKGAVDKAIDYMTAIGPSKCFMLQGWAIVPSSAKNVKKAIDAESTQHTKHLSYDGKKTKE